MVETTLHARATLTPDERREIRGLLDVAFAGAFSDEDWRHALGGTHVWAVTADGIVAHGAVVSRRLRCAGTPLEAGYVEAVATRPAHQRRGHGSAVMHRVNGIIRARYAIGALSTGRSAFYARLGWEAWRGPSGVRTAEGVRPTPEDDGGLMVLRTPRTPAVDPDGTIECDWRPGDVW